MSKINVLHSTVFNRIAAGEVVERPFSVVKELVENSIDAGATVIDIEVLGAGLSRIEITDNGSGIYKGDLVNAFMPHATSKVTKLEDLDSIKTLGFRGEAIASIASVSKMSINSKPKEQETAFSLVCEGGVLGQITPSSLDGGTVITVDSLFYNTPVRAKFLKSNRSEIADISNIASRIILGNSHIKFTLSIDDKLQIQTFGDGLEGAMVALYGLDALNDCFYIDTVKSGIRIYGYIGKQYFSKPNKSYQSLFINSRYVLNSTVAAAIGNAYSAYLMKRQYPFYVLNIDLPYSAVDVNVHPNKTEVRFENNQVIYSAVYSTISAVLDGTGKAAEIVKGGFIDNDSLYKIAYKKDNLAYDKTSFTDSDRKSESSTQISAENLSLENADLSGIVDKKKVDNLRANERIYKGTNIDISGVKVCDHTYKDDSVFLENKKFLDKSDNEQKLSDKFSGEIKEVQMSKDNYKELVDDEFLYVGQLFNTYLLYSKKDEFVIIDQHAAHERLLYDNYLRDFNNQTIYRQPLLIPHILNLNYNEYDFIKDKLEILSGFGFDIMAFGGNSFKVNEIPALFKNFDIAAFFTDIFSNLENSFKQDFDYFKEKIAMAACKAATKGGDKLSQEQSDKLFELIKDNLGIRCPHGRPIAVSIKKQELEKWFKRIV